MRIYHNPRCSKSRQTLELLQEHGHQPQVIEYLKTPPNAAELAEIAAALALPPAQFIRFKEAEAKELGITANDQRSDEDWFEIIAQHPKLLERPIVVVNERAAIGRPPESVLKLFG